MNILNGPTERQKNISKNKIASASWLELNPWDLEDYSSLGYHVLASNATGMR